MQKVIEEKNIVEEKENSISFKKNSKGLVEFKNVSFRYPDAEYDVITDISFTANPGETTAFIGSTGSGKSTIVNLLPRFYDITSGSIFLDGIDTKKNQIKIFKKSNWGSAARRIFV